MLIFSNTKERHLYFQSEETLKHWQEDILRNQGFLQERLAQYELLGKIGQGSFGEVLAGKHKFSGKKITIKKIRKELIRTVFDKNQQ